MYNTTSVRIEYNPKNNSCYYKNKHKVCSYFIPDCNEWCTCFHDKSYSKKEVANAWFPEKYKQRQQHKGQNQVVNYIS